METKENPEVHYTSPAFAMCGVCDGEYPAGTVECPKCKSPLSSVRKCSECGRILSAKHDRCLYCKASFIQRDGADAPAATPQLTRTGNPSDEARKRKAILVSVGVFLLVMFFGLYGTMAKLGKAGPEVAATSYILSGASLRLQPNANAGSSRNLGAGTVVSFTGMAADPEGRKWYVVREGNSDEFLSVREVAPPKVRLPELGSQMLRAWLMAFRDPSLIPEADSAVHYFCANFASSPHCDELRWLAAERFRLMAEHAESSDGQQRARDLYQAIADGKGPIAADAAKAIEKLKDTKPERLAPATKNHRSGIEKSSAYGSGHEYALVDRAEVRVKVPEAKSLVSTSQLRAPIANEIRINGKVAVPSNAICVLKVLQSGSNELAVQLTAIEFGNKQYQVSTEPKLVSPSSTTVVFPLESSLLIGK